MLQLKQDQKNKTNTKKEDCDNIEFLMRVQKSFLFRELFTLRKPYCLRSKEEKIDTHRKTQKRRKKIYLSNLINIQIVYV